MNEQPESGENPELPGLEELLRASQGITPDMTGAISAMASVHAQWRQAWADTGKFTDEETFELVRLLVASSAGGIRSLGLSWLPEGRTSHRRPGS